MNVSSDDAIVGLALIALLAGTAALVRYRVEREPVVVVDLALRDGAAADIAGFVRFFKSLQALARPGWEGALFGQPWVAFEFHVEDGVLHARCAVPVRHAEFVHTLLQSAVSDIETSPAD